MRNSTNTKMLKLYRQLEKIALKEVERLARKALKQNPKHFKEFVMCMGTFFFTDPTGEVLYDHLAEKRSGYKPLYDFIAEWDRELKLTGSPMRFTATSEITTDW